MGRKSVLVERNQKWRLASIGWLLVALVALGFVAVECQEQLIVESRQQKEQSSSENELADTLKYLEKLEKLDQYWSEVARPRFGRSEYKQPNAQRLRLAQTSAGELAQPIQTRPLGRTLTSGLRNFQMAPIGRSSLVDLISARLNQRYNSNEAY